MWRKISVAFVPPGIRLMASGLMADAARLNVLPRGGLHVWARLPDGVDDLALTTVRGQGNHAGAPQKCPRDLEAHITLLAQLLHHGIGGRLRHRR